MTQTWDTGLQGWQEMMKFMSERYVNKSLKARLILELIPKGAWITTSTGVGSID